MKTCCSFSQQTRSIAPRGDIENGGEEDLWNQIRRDKRGISNDNAVTTKRRATIGGKDAQKLKEDKRKSVANSPPTVGDHLEVDRSLQLKRQNSATKIQSLARMKRGKEKVKTIREQRRMTVV